MTSQTRRDGSRLAARGRDKGDYFALIAAIDAKVFVDGEDAVLRVQFAHPDQAEIGQVRFAITIAFGQGGKLRQVIVAIEGEPDQTFIDHFEDDPGISEMKCGLGQHRLAGKEWLANVPSHV